MMGDGMKAYTPVKQSQPSLRILSYSIRLLWARGTLPTSASELGPEDGEGA